ncbi:type III pantothenate kinase [Chitinimonas sp. BJB300]|uniref:type III pantothenate kinase n=1 Tax=Chitinimonas sp. BJB300 TaxID=1559339 RepID=UPI000C0D37C9|nr:type III pantothenate kinase [Chitinimonas sp. BJB300]PHV11903.1 type III pantothenate kinase [Chitinimonas sp. BJB300]TSJ91481.1 type III pantothenate kinase [Chitinimonas sp. BJB300]
MSTCLLLDAGNTRLKWALLSGNEWLAEGIADYTTLAALHAELAALPAPESILGSNVAGPNVAAGLEAQFPRFPIQWLRSKPTEAGLRNQYREPSQLGPDRWAAMIGARSLSSGDTLVVMAGTAMTVDALSAEGDFLGGLIVPGFRLMREALARGTADLGLPDGTPVAFPRSTGEAIINGALAALTGAIAGQYAQLVQQTGRPVRIVLSGGDAALITSKLPPALAEQLMPVDNLVLRGLAYLARIEPLQETQQ